MTLLIPENPLMVLPSLAVAIGLHRAIVLQQLHYWLTRSDHVHEGQRWVYNSLAKWQRQFPFWTDRTVRQLLADLEAQGIIASAMLHTNPMNREKWYTIRYENVPCADASAIGKSFPHAGGENFHMIHTETTLQQTTVEATSPKAKTSKSPELAEAEAAWKAAGLSHLSMNASGKLRALIAEHGLPLVLEGITKAAEQSVRSPVAWMQTVLPAWKRERSTNEPTQRPGAYAGGGAAPRPGGYAPVADAAGIDKWFEWGKTPDGPGGWARGRPTARTGG